MLLKNEHICFKYRAGSKIEFFTPSVSLAGRRNFFMQNLFETNKKIIYQDSVRYCALREK